MSTFLMRLHIKWNNVWYVMRHTIVCPIGLFLRKIMNIVRNKSDFHDLNANSLATFALNEKSVCVWGGGSRHVYVGVR